MVLREQSRSTIALIQLILEEVMASRGDRIIDEPGTHGYANVVHLFLPDMFKNPQAAKKAIQRDRLTGTDSIYLLNNFCPMKWAFVNFRQRRYVRARLARIR